MPAAADWKLLMGVDPEDLGEDDEKICDLILMVKPRDLKADDSEKMIQLFRISQTLLRMKLDEIKCAYEVVDSAGVEQARIENELKAKVLKLEGELEMAQRVMGGGDTRFLRDEIHQLESHLERKERELALRAEEAEEKNRKLKRENEQLQQDVEFYRKEVEQREPLQTKEESNEIQRRLTKANQQLYQCMEDLQHAEDMAANLKSENEHLQKNLEESVKEMEKMTDEYNKMKIAVQQTDAIMDQLRKERDHAKLQVRELNEQIQARVEEDDPVMAAVNAKVEEWKAVQERDNQIKMLSEQVEQYTTEMEKNAVLIEELKKPLKKDKGHVSVQQRRLEDMSSKLQVAEKRALEAERTAHLAERDARDKDKELNDTLTRIRLYESGTDGLEAAITEIKECKNHIRVRDREIESMIKEINQLEIKINNLLDENEDLRERLGLNAKEELDLSEFRRSKILKQRQYKAENQVLLKEIERLEEERLELKQRIRALVKDKGLSVVSSAVLDDSVEEKPSRSSVSGSTDEEMKRKNERLQKELSNKEKELELKRTESAQFKARLNEMLNENKQLEQGMKEILQAIQDTQTKTPTSTGVSIPSLERLVNALEMKYSEGKFDASLHLRSQVDQLTGRNEELRQEMKAAREEAANTLNQLTKANEKIARLESEVESMSKSAGTSILYKSLALPEEIPPTSAEAINALNEYMIQLLQEIKNKGDSIEQLSSALEEYKRKFAVIRHQQGLLYKEYQSERESWQKDRDSFAELKSKLEEQREVDAVKVKEYNDPREIRHQLAETARKMMVLRVNEKCLTRRYTTLLELEQHLRKENGKLKDDFSQMEAAVTERIGYLQRFKEMAAFKMAALQKSLDGSVPASELERANKQYTELTIKYRNLLQKDNHLVQKTTTLEHLERENVSLHERINSINKELEISKEKLHTLEQAWENICTTGGENGMDKAAKALANSEIVSVSRRITTLEMKELNERQRAEHAQKMYEHLRSSLKQVEERNFELETKFAERIERELRDELADSVSKDISDADRKRITELEKTEADLRIEVSKLREVSDVAKMQVSALEARQQSREKEVESLRRQVLDYQAQSDEKALIAKLHQHIVALQLSETTAISRLEAANTRLQKLEAQKLRVEQQLDAQQQALWHARQEGHQRARHLRHTIQALRRQFSGALPLAQQEKFSNTMLQLQEDKARAKEEAHRAEEERRKAEGKAQELELKLKGLEELIATLKDARGAQKKLEEVRLLEMRQGRELGGQREEIKYLRNIVAEQERTISGLEEELVQQNNLLEERQLIWDQREVQLERQLDTYEKQQNEVLSTAQKFEEATGSLPDPNQPLAHQLDYALGKIKEHVRTILETKATCKILEERLKEKEAALWTSEQNVLSRDKVINELRLRLPAAAEREKLLADLSKQEDSDSQPALKVAHQTINNLQGRLDQKEEEQEEIAKRHEEEVRALHQKLDVYMDTSLDCFKQTALELMKKPTITVPTNKHLVRLAEMEQMVAEQDNSLSSLTHKLKVVTTELDQQKQVTAAQAMEHAAEIARLEERHVAQMKSLSQETEELRAQLIQMEKELHFLRTELEAQKEANVRSPSNTMKNLVERLKTQLALKEKQLKALSKALLELRAELTSQAEQQIIANAAQKEEALNVQQIVDKQTKELKACVKDLNEELQLAKDGVRAAKARENSLREELESLNKDLQRSHKSHNKLQGEKESLEDQLNELKKKVQRLSSGLQAQVESDGPTVEALQKKIRKLEQELDRKGISEPADKRSVLKEDKSSKEEIVRWEEGKKWQTKVEKVRTVLKEKEKEVESLSKQLATIKELYSRLELEKMGLQKKLKGRGVTADQVVGVRTLEADREIEELQRRNTELEQQIKVIKQQQALPRDAAMEDITIRNRYLEERLHSLESQLSKESPSRPSDKHVALPSQLNWSSKVTHSVTFDISEGETRSPLVNDTIHETEAVTEKEIAVTESKATQTSFSAAEVSQDEERSKENLGDSVVDIEPEDLVNESKSEQEEKDKKEALLEKDTKEPDETQGGQGEHAQEELKTNEDAEETDSGLTHQEITDKPLEGDQLEVETAENEKTNAEENRTHTEPEMSKEHLEDNQQDGNKEQEGDPSQNVKTSAGSKELEEEETAHSTVDSNLVLEQPAMEETKSFIPEEDVDPIVNENVKCSPTKELDAGVIKSELDANLGPVESEVTTFHDKEPTMKSKVKSGKQTSGRGSGTPSQREHELQKENLKLSTENLELRFQLEQANKDLPRLKSEYEKLKGKQEEQLNARLESKTKGLEKIMMENERLRKDIKKEAEAAEKLRVTKSSLEVANEKLKAELEETNQRLLLAQSKGPSLEGADSKTWKSSVVARLFENKMKGLESEIAKKNSSISELKVQLKEANEKQQATQHTATTDAGLAREYQSLRLASKQLEREKAQLLRQIQKYDEQFGTNKAGPELEDLKFNYNLEVKKNIILEEQLKKLSDQFGVPLPVDVSIS
ncbi:Centrosomal protein of 290 kDa [Labeo rohita]|uniref:Centrosomal protein of 290 kDa n=1 Tax=Labeo rohita TaxID=84645 RepID=A0ABQ8LFE3_LABRO|nr:Centrosomal protein of 290 kDa [Labeo rohita]